MKRKNADSNLLLSPKKYQKLTSLEQLGCFLSQSLENSKGIIIYFVKKFISKLERFLKCKIKAYGSLTKDTFICGISDIDLILYYSKSSLLEFYKCQIVKFLETYGLEFNKFQDKFRIFLDTKGFINNSKQSLYLDAMSLIMDLNLVENYSSQFHDFLNEIPLQEMSLKEFEIEKGIEKEIRNVIETEGKIKKKKEITDATTFFIKSTLQENTEMKEFVLVVKFWGYSRPKNSKTFKAKSLAFELLGIQSFLNSDSKTLPGKFKEFLQWLSNNKDIKVVFSKYYQKFIRQDKIRRIVEFKGNIVVDPGNILSLLDVDFDSLKLYAQKTLEIMDIKGSGLKLKDLFQAYSLSKIIISKFEFNFSVSKLSKLKKMDKFSYIVNGKADYVHPAMVESKSEPKWYQEFKQYNIIAAIATLFICYEVDMINFLDNENTLLEKTDILGYFDLINGTHGDSQLSSEKKIELYYAFSDRSKYIHATLEIGDVPGENHDIHDIPTDSATQTDWMYEFDDVEEFCERHRIDLTVSYDTSPVGFNCHLLLTKKIRSGILNIGEFTGSDCSMALSRKKASEIALESWSEVLHREAFLSPRTRENPMQADSFQKLLVLCHRDDVLWSLNYERNEAGFACHLTLTKNHEDINLGKFSASAPSRALSKIAAAALVIPNWNEIIQGNRIGSVADKFEVLLKLLQPHGIVWSLNYEKDGTVVNSQLRLTKRVGKRTFNLGTFLASDSSKASAKNRVALLAMDRWTDIMREMARKLPEPDIFEVFKEFCESQGIVWGIHYEKKDKQTTCHLELTKKYGKKTIDLGTFVASESSQSLSKDNAASLALEKCREMMQTEE